MPSTAEWVQGHRAFGKSRRAARVAGLQDAVRESEAEQLARGFADYPEEQVRQSLVHTRQDLVLVIGHLDELHRLGRSLRRWLIAATLFLGGLVVHFVA